MIHLSRSTLSVMAAIVVGVLAVLAGCWVARQPATPATPPTVTRPATVTAIPITVRPVTLTPTLVSPTLTPTARPSAPASRTFTPNPSTLITPSPQVLPGTGEGQITPLAGPALACGVGLILMGLVLLWVRKPKG